MFLQSPDPKSDLPKMSFRRPVLAIRWWFSGLKLQHKIGWSFGLVASVAIVGMATGWSVAEFYLNQAKAEIEDSETEHTMLNEMEVKLLRMHLHQKGTILTLNDLSQWTEVYETFINDRNQFQASWQRYIDTQEIVYGNTPYDQKERQLIASLKVSYEMFSQDLDSLNSQVSQGKPLQLSDSDRRALQITLTQFNNEGLRQDAYQFLSLVQELSNIAEIQLQEAKTRVYQAESLRMTLIAASVIASMIIAAILLSLLSQRISVSVEKSAAIAEEIIETANFDLQIPVTSTDEIGKLSLSLNRLITQIKQLLQQEQAKTESLEDALCELQSTQSILLQSEKMSALGQMVAGIAHEINNPVTFIHGNLGHLQDHVKALIYAVQLYQQQSPVLSQSATQELEELDIDFLIQDSADILKSMEIGTYRICDIVLALRNFSRLDEAELKRVNIHEGIDSTLVILSHRLKANNKYPEIEVIKHYASLPKVECYPGQLNQVFMNILSNAIDAFEEGDKNLTYAEIEANPRQIHIYTEVLDNEQIRIRIRDNGPGIPDHIIGRLFDPFFTTKDVGKGTGLGLAISYKIVTEKHQGTLHCCSQLGQGTEFLVQIPIHLSKAQISLPTVSEVVSSVASSNF